MNIKHIRNFSIIAHIDHGKSTLADRIIENTGGLTKREMKSQVLDSMELERERGITIKAQNARLSYINKNGKKYLFNLIDTPGHVDFTYEVSRSLAACEGVLLLIDATQGVEAQTLSNVYMAIEHNLEIIPVINKIDLPSADVEGIKMQIEDIIGIDSSKAICASAKEGVGIVDILEAVIDKIPAPKGNPEDPLKALLFDSWYDPYQGTIILIRVFDGSVKKGDVIKFLSNDKTYEVSNVGIFNPKPVRCNSISAGEVGFIVSGIKNIDDTKVGDTVTLFKNPTSTALPGYKEPKPMVFCGLFPIDSSQYEFLRDALNKLSLNDSSFFYEPETSLALGFGFRCGFLGLLHMDIIKERLEREFNLKLIATAPAVIYEVHKANGEVVNIDNPAKLPKAQEISSIHEPYISATIFTPESYIGAVINLSQERRGIHKSMEFITKDKIIVKYEYPFNEIVLDFYNSLKSITKGYASMEYDYIDFRPSSLAKVDILINGDKVDALSTIVFADKAYQLGRLLTQKIKEFIPRQMYEVAIQAAIGNKVISRETVKALRKNVTAKCYGGDITRKRKLLEKQKEGKKKMKQIGKVEIPQEAFLAILKTERN